MLCGICFRLIVIAKQALRLKFNTVSLVHFEKRLIL